MQACMVGNLEALICTSTVKNTSAQFLTPHQNMNGHKYRRRDAQRVMQPCSLVTRSSLSAHNHDPWRLSLRSKGIEVGYSCLGKRRFAEICHSKTYDKKSRLNSGGPVQLNIVQGTLVLSLFVQFEDEILYYRACSRILELDGSFSYGVVFKLNCRRNF